MDNRSETWPVPYVSKLQGGGIQPGQTLIVRGVPVGERFDINLSSDASLSGSIPLHVSVRLNEKAFVFNTKDGEEWGKEVRKKCTFKMEEPFDIRIRAHQDKFEVMVDQKELCEYEYKKPLSAIDHLVVDGSLALHAVNWGGKYYPVPYQAGIDGGFTPGKRLYVSGNLEDKGKRFSINLLSQSGDKVLHFNPRFDEKCCVRNACMGGDWGSEEREGKMPLEKNKIFDIIIANESYAFQVYVNGQHFCAFAHRTEPNSAVGLEIDGEVELQGVHVK
jgi:hypothetical protein